MTFLSVWRSYRSTETWKVVFLRSRPAPLSRAPRTSTSTSSSWPSTTKGCRRSEVAADVPRGLAGPCWCGPSSTATRRIAGPRAEQKMQLSPNTRCSSWKTFFKFFASPSSSSSFFESATKEGKTETDQNKRKKSKLRKSCFFLRLLQKLKTCNSRVSHQITFGSVAKVGCCCCHQSDLGLNWNLSAHGGNWSRVESLSRNETICESQIGTVVKLFCFRSICVFFTIRKI